LSKNNYVSPHVDEGILRVIVCIPENRRKSLPVPHAVKTKIGCFSWNLIIIATIRWWMVTKRQL